MCNGRGGCGHGCLRFVVGAVGCACGRAGGRLPGAAERMMRWRRGRAPWRGRHPPADDGDG
ncbi:hypothetical protein BSLA_01r4764 [Burkholderia stabilis]|nr:hypothetical protein BSLA_01r4764 [Burkholderia stabilis]